MASKRFTDEFKAEAVKQVSERGYPVTEVAERLGVSSHSLYGWLRERGISREVRKAKKSVDLVQENARLRAELRRAEEERDILKKAAVSSTRRRNGLAQLSGWRLEAQGLTRSFVETSGDLVQECLRMA
uniref:transposase n=1 Tax=Pseudoxanthomonas japonensis TaxID=69284 RepID=UPI001BCDFE0D